MEKNQYGARSLRKFLFQDKFDLLERAAQVVADAVLGGFPAVKEVTVRVKKPYAPIKADFDYTAVEITRERADSESVEVQA